VSECDRKASKIRRSWPTSDSCAMGGVKLLCIIVSMKMANIPRHVWERSCMQKTYKVITLVYIL